MNIFFQEKSHPLTSWAFEKKPRMLSYESKFSRRMRNMGNAAEYFMFFKWKSKILVCLCIFYKHFWVKNKGTNVFTNHFCLGWKEVRLRLTEIPWAVELSWKTARFQRNRSRPKTVISFEVIFQKRLRVFYRGFHTRQNCFRVFGNTGKTRSRSFWNGFSIGA